MIAINNNQPINFLLSLMSGYLIGGSLGLAFRLAPEILSINFPSFHISVLKYLRYKMPLVCPISLLLLHLMSTYFRGVSAFTASHITPTILSRTAIKHHHYSPTTFMMATTAVTAASNSTTTLVELGRLPLTKPLRSSSRWRGGKTSLVPTAIHM